MRVMRDEATKLFKPKGFSKAKDADAHKEAEVADEVSVEAHHITWGGVSLISPHHKDEDFHILHREVGIPKDFVEYDRPIQLFTPVSSRFFIL